MERTHPAPMPPLEIPVCLHCATPNRPATTFCTACGAPMSVIATAGPFETALMQARVLGELAGNRRPSRLLVWGAWGLVLPYLGLALVVLLTPGRGGSRSLGGWLVGGLFLALLVYGLLRFSRRPHGPAASDAEDPEAEDPATDDVEAAPK